MDIGTSKGKQGVIRFTSGFFQVLLILCTIFTVNGQVTFVVDSLPESSKVTDSLYLSGSFNNWNPADENYRLKPAGDGTFKVDLKVFDHSWISYKVTRGSWEDVEVNNDGLPILTRKLSIVSREQRVHLQIKGWSDRDGVADKKSSVKLVLAKIPENTPPNAILYATGNFNGWTPGDQRYQLNRSADGTYAIDVPVFWDRLEYKFTRGNWNTVEGKAYGRPRPNRIANLTSETLSIPIISSISHWEDQSFGLFNPYTLVLVLTALQGILLIFIINSYKNNNRWANRTLSVLIFLISFALMARVVIYDRNIYTDYPKISLLTDVVYFLYAPLFLIYIKRLLNKSKGVDSRNWVHFIPFGLQCIVYTSYFLELPHSFIEKDLFQSYDSPIYFSYDILVVAALLFNIWYWFKIKYIIHNYFKNIEQTYSTDQNIRYLNNIMVIMAINLIIWSVILMISGFGLLKGYNLQSITNVLIDIMWVVFSFIVYSLGYFAIKQPEIFKINPEEKVEVEKPHLNEAEMEQLKTELNRVMETEQAYLNPALNLPELAEKMNSNVHVLSRAINEGFNKNFRDFVNHYRVLDFIDRAQQDNYKNQTFLAIALDVGFNSKSSFNRSFKKATGKSPRDYFNN
ncbi:helix-turn-helix domain-containing protein [Flagellimonas sp. 2504JD4-2]